ncbi:hypothetical protein AB7C87_07145 [Natrarchaeobius sp. A-rgal3]|uniref:hypothetical protein n=1 Tax=Natrarchaeobius versutus TaxID=1679078 RepID=UPI00350F5471
MASNTLSRSHTKGRSRVWRQVFFIAGVSALLFIPSDARTVVSHEVMIATVTGGLFFGVAVDVTLSRIDTDRFTGRQQLLALLIALGSVYLFSWIFLPVVQYAPLAHFGVAFLWGMTLSQVASVVLLND